MITLNFLPFTLIILRMHAHFGFIYQFQQLIQDVCGKLKHHIKKRQTGISEVKRLTGISEVKRQTGISEVIAHKKNVIIIRFHYVFFKQIQAAAK